MKKTVDLEEIRAVTAKFASIFVKMDYLTTLTPLERTEQRGQRIGRKKLGLLKNRVEAARQHLELLPATFDLETLERDTVLALALGELIAVLEKIWDSVADTLMVVGNPAIINAATATTYITVAETTARRLKPTKRGSKTQGTVPVTSSASPSASDPPKAPEAPVQLPSPSTEQAA